MFPIVRSCIPLPQKPLHSIARSVTVINYMRRYCITSFRAQINPGGSLKAQIEPDQKIDLQVTFIWLCIFYPELFFKKTRKYLLKSNFLWCYQKNFGKVGNKKKAKLIRFTKVNLDESNSGTTNKSHYCSQLREKGEKVFFHQLYTLKFHGRVT